ncbi:UbiD family decarboxylase [Streptomyces sp. NPDC050560]|uniref:UbiD family decarboxylase n=1 Tax=Streptomyces sp. NPDC050560 TaxID=3365630 RepID=UPI0037977F88
MPAHPPFDLRAWLDTAHRLNDVRTLHGAHWDKEIGAAGTVNYQRPAPPALLFDDIVGYRPGLRVLTSSTSNARLLGMTLRLGTDMTDRSLVQALRSRPGQWAADAHRYPVREVSDGPVLQNVRSAPEASLLDLPVPRWHEGDGGRYAGTGCAVFTTDPETGQLNAGAYRMQVHHGGRTATVNMEAGKHGAAHVRKWFAREGRAPLTATLGSDPLLLIASGTEVPGTVSELEYVGAVLGEPVDVIPGDLTGLPVPATAEICVEGWLYPDKRELEGPFGEWTGYYSGGQTEVLAMDIERMYFRDDPILLGAPPGKPPHDYSYMRSVMKSAMIHDALVGTGLPGLEAVWAHESGGGRQLIAVAVHQQYPGHARQAGHLAAHLPAAAYMNKFVVVVDADVDPRSLDEVVWAMCTRTDPAQDIETLRQTWGSRVDPLKEAGAPPFNTRAVIDACRPWSRLDSFPPVAEADRGLLDEMLRRWPKELGGAR